jgi:hypothetical protein
MKRIGLGFACMALLLVLLPFTASGCWISCACATPPPQPDGTFPGITDTEAASDAARVAGVPLMTTAMIGGPDGEPFYKATATGTVALVDGYSGTVIEVMFEDKMPSDATGSASTAQALAAATAFIDAVDPSLLRNLASGTTPTVDLIRPAGVAAYDVKWTEGSPDNAPTFEVMANASTGSVFAYIDRRVYTRLAAPVVGRDRATQLAIAALGVPGETVTSAELMIEFVAEIQHLAWQVGLGVPTATQADVFEHGALIRVDAVTGEATIVKS